MVAGGWSTDTGEDLDSVELLVLGQSAWQQAEPLPVKMRGTGAAVIDNVPYFFGNHSLMHQYRVIFLLFYNVGGYSPEKQDFILKFNSTTSSMEQVGTMLTARSHFGISTLTNDLVENLIKYCL